jgi:hypothetical protein
LVTESLFDQTSRFAEKASFENFRAVLRDACVRENPAWTALENHFNFPTRQLL